MQKNNSEIIPEGIKEFLKNIIRDCRDCDQCEKCKWYHQEEEEHEEQDPVGECMFYEAPKWWDLDEIMLKVHLNSLYGKKVKGGDLNE